MTYGGKNTVLTSILRMYHVELMAKYREIHQQKTCMVQWLIRPLIDREFGVRCVSGEDITRMHKYCIRHPV